jgi:hypothetical protein
MACSILDNSISVRQIEKQHNVEPVLKKNHPGLFKLKCKDKKGERLCEFIRKKTGCITASGSKGHQLLAA